MSRLFEFVLVSVLIAVSLLLLGIPGWVLVANITRPASSLDANMTSTQIDGAARSLWRVHDRTRGATCWMTSSAISCLSDGVLNPEGYEIEAAP